MGNECGFDAVVTVVPGDEVLRRSVPPTDQSIIHVRTDIVLELAVVILIDIFCQTADPHFLVICAVVR